MRSRADGHPFDIDMTRSLNVTCPSCRSVLVDMNENDDDPGDFTDPFMSDELFDQHSWLLYSAFRDHMTRNAEQTIQWDTGPAYQIIHDMIALQVHREHQQVESRSLGEAINYRYDLDGQSREMLWNLAFNFGVDSFRCYRAPADSGVNYFLAADYLDEHTQGVRRVRAYQPIPNHILEMQRQIASSGTVQLEVSSEDSLEQIPT